MNIFNYSFLLCNQIMSPWILHASTFFFSALKENRVKLIYFSWYNIKNWPIKKKCNILDAQLRPNYFSLKGPVPSLKLRLGQEPKSDNP